MAKIALLGFGTVGSGVAEIIDANRNKTRQRCGVDMEIKYILDLRDFPSSPYADKIVHDYNVILSDPEISIVVEMMGGVHPAGDFVMQALEHGKNAVTSNKAVVAAMGPELLKKATENGVRFLYEASTGGGIPILRPLKAQADINDISEICGILNGTTNYILSSMRNNGLSFSEALGEAQNLGYAERDPSADVDGYDTCRKICILAATAYGKLVPFEKVNTVGIRNITPKILMDAAKRECEIKLIGRAYRDENGIHIFCGPAKVKKGCILSNIGDVTNAVLVNGEMSGELVFVGSGAGKLPTADAVISDVIDILLYPNSANDSWEWDSGNNVNDIIFEKDSPITPINT